MDPSHTNSVGATNPGGTNPGNLNAQNTNPNAQVLQGGQQNPAQPVMPQQPMQPTTMQQPAISFGTGDVVIGGGNTASSKKSRKGVVILIILVVLLAFVGGGFLLWQNGVFGGRSSGGGQTSQMTDLEKSYNSYVNYVLWGVESDGKPDLSAIGEVVKPYFEDLRNNETLLDDYINKVSVKYNALKEAYEGKDGDRLDISVLKSYFEEYARIVPMNQNEMISEYTNGGEEAVKKAINDRYRNDSNDEYFTAYIEKTIELNNFQLGMLINIDKAGCLKDGTMVAGCYQMNEADNEKMGKMMIDVSDAFYSMKNEAFDVVDALYFEFYGEGDENNGQNA